MTLHAVYFSPMGGTANRAMALAQVVAQELGCEVKPWDYTLPTARVPLPQFAATDVVLWASPVYAGRLPNKMLDYVTQNLRGSQSPFIGLVTFGNRSAGQALAELVGIARRGGCVPVGAAAVVMPHVFSRTLAAERPTEADNLALRQFGHVVAARIKQGASVITPFDNEEPTTYYTPLRADGTPAQFLKAKPIVDGQRCNGCGRCAAVCPMGSIVLGGGVAQVQGLCIKCQACIQQCPVGAVALLDEAFLSHVSMLEQTFAAPAGNVFV